MNDHNSLVATERAKTKKYKSMLIEERAQAADDVGAWYCSLVFPYIYIDWWYFW